MISMSTLRRSSAEALRVTSPSPSSAPTVRLIDGGVTRSKSLSDPSSAAVLREHEEGGELAVGDIGAAALEPHPASEAHDADAQLVIQVGSRGCRGHSP